MKQTNRTSNVVESFKLYYEDLERKRMKTAPVKLNAIKKPTKKVEKKTSFKKNMLNKLQPVRNKFNTAMNKIKAPKKKAKKPTRLEKKTMQHERNRVILGIGLLLVVVSITYSTSVILLGVDSIGSKIALLPQVAFALLISIKAFSK